MSRALLLSSDHHELELVARVLTEPRAFVVLVVPRWLEEAAQEALFETIHPQEVVESPTPEEVVHYLAHGGEEVVLMRPPSVREICEALNIHREKLRTRPLRLVLWLRGEEEFGTFLRAAPDAYSFRSRVAVLRGERVVEAVDRSDTEEIRQARERLQLAPSLEKQVEARLELASLLANANQSEEAEFHALRALGEAEGLDRRQWFKLLATTELQRIYRMDQRDGKALARSAQAFDQLRRAPQDPRHWARALTYQPGPPQIGPSLMTIREMEKVLPRIQGSQAALGWMDAKAVGLMLRGDLNEARSILRGLSFEQAFNRSVAQLHLGQVEYRAGELERAMEHLRTALEEESREVAFPGSRMGPTQLLVFLNSGEIQTAASLLLEMEGELAPTFRAILAVEQSDLAEALRQVRLGFALFKRPRALAEHWEESLTVLLDLMEEGALDEPAWAELLDTLTHQEAALSGPPRWHAVSLLGVHASLLQERADRLDEALDLRRQALSLCVDESAELRPMALRLLGQTLARAGRHHEALEHLSLAEAEADALDLRFERARALVQAFGSLAALGGLLEEVLAEARRAAQSTGSRWTVADTLADMAEHLADEGYPTSPESLLREARRNYSDMPHPQGTGRCLELTARWLEHQGDAEGAALRRKQALGLYERYGLVLRAERLRRRMG